MWSVMWSQYGLYFRNFAVFVVFKCIIVVADETLSENYGKLSQQKCLEYHPVPGYDVFAISGGNKSLTKEFPHMAAIGFGDNDDIQWLCGGSLISKKFVLTAAHCVVSPTGAPKFVRLGDLDLSTDDDDAKPQDFTIKRIITYPLYKPPAKYHDIAMLELDQEANFTGYVSPACLNTEAEVGSRELIATGWGRTGYIDGASSFLLKVALDPVPSETCLDTFGKYSSQHLPKGILNHYQICAGKVQGLDTCQGDSGGPLQTKNKNRSFLDITVHNIVGITSFGKACALTKSPGIYTRVSGYIPWIERIAWEHEE